MGLHVAAPLARLFHGIDRAVGAWSSRRDLEMLDDRMLKDLGISRAQVEFEVRRAPWNTPTLGGR